jgi:hypothetical protein
MPSGLFVTGRHRLRVSARQPVGAVAGLLLLASALSAQTLPVPVLPPEQPAPTGLDPQAAAAGASFTEPVATGQWDYGLGLGVGYDSNIDFRAPGGPSSWAVSPRGNFTRVFRSRQGQLRLGGRGNWIGYQSHESLNRYSADLNLAGDYRSSVNTTWKAGASYEVGYSDSSRVLGEQGVMLPLVRTRGGAANIGVTRALGVQTALQLTGRYYRTMFDQQDVDTYGLRNGQSMRATAGLERKFGLRNTTVTQYSLEAVDREGGETYLTHFGSLQWSHLLTPRSGLLLEAGGSYTPESVQAGLEREAYFFGGASYARQVRQSTVTLVARREVVPAFGFGVSRVQDRFGLAARIPIRRIWSLQLSGMHWMGDSSEATSDYGSRDEASVILTRRLGQHFEVSTEGRYRRRGAAGTQPEMDQLVAGLYLSLVSASGGAGGRAPGQ